MTESVIRVLILEDQRDIREGLGFLIGSTPGFQCTGTFDSVEQALARLPPGVTDVADVALVDIGLPGMSGIDGIRLMKERYSSLRFLTLTVYEDDDRIFQALCAGASGYLLKKTPPARLLESLREVLSGGAALSPEIAGRVINLFRTFAPPEAADYRLTPHEQRLLKLLCDGHSYKTAAAEIGGSVNTVGFHMRSIYSKLQVHSKSEAVAKALRSNLFR